MPRLFNFAAGPAMMPEPVLARARDELLDWNGHGLSVMEMPFTGDVFKEIASTAVSRLSALLGLPPGYRVLFMHGGAMAQLALVPLNLAAPEVAGDAGADYVESGYWSGRAIAEARRYCRVEIAASGEPGGFTHIPPQTEWCIRPEAAYCHITTNETANGVQFPETPKLDGVPLVADMTSDFLTRPVDVSSYGLLYASAQKNVGPSGLTIVILREELGGHAHALTPSVFDYSLQMENDSRYNTPPTFSIYMAGLVFQWIEEEGGLAAMERASEAKSSKLYGLIDGSDFYCCPVAPEARSRVNVCFKLADETLDDVFDKEALEHGLINLRGHPVLGGFRASLYNAMSEYGVDVLVEFMADFESRHG
jgi:phosphoserine aminotransferase